MAPAVGEAEGDAAEVPGRVMGTEDLITETMLATAPRGAAPKLRPVDRPWVFPGRIFFNRFRRRSYDGVPLFFTDGLSPKEDRAFRRRYRDLSLVFAYYTLGRETVALIWHPRYEVVHAIDGMVRWSAGINPHHDALLSEVPTGDVPRDAGRAAGRLDYAIALRAFDRAASTIYARGGKGPTRLPKQLDPRALANGEAWLRRQLEGLGKPWP